MKNRGFTLLEVMVTLTIFVILVMLAVPSFSSLMRDSRMTTNANDIVTSLNYVRSEAVARNVSVAMLKQGAVNNTWDGGWQIFTDFDNDGVLDVVDGDTLLKVHEAMPIGFTLRTTGSATRVTYSATGSSNVAVTFRLCGENADINYSKSIIVSFLGRVRVAEGTLICP